MNQFLFRAVKRLTGLLVAAGFFLVLTTAAGETGTANITWTIDPKSETYTNDQTKLRFRKAIAGFSLNQANPAQKDGTAKFVYHGTVGIISVYFVHRGPMGCVNATQCVASMVDDFRSEMKRLHGKYDFEKGFTLQREGRRRGRATMYHFVAPRDFGMPVYSEVGAFSAGEFVFCYRATFMQERGLTDLALFLREFGVKRS